MNFKLTEDTSDIATLADQLRALEQSGGKLPPSTRALIEQASRMLNECRSQMAFAAEQLERAAALRVGFMDSESKHTEVARQKDSVMTEQAQFLRTLLQQKTPRKTDEVI
jgi:hypothetical protein